MNDNNNRHPCRGLDSRGNLGCGLPGRNPGTFLFCRSVTRPSGTVYCGTCGSVYGHVSTYTDARMPLRPNADSTYTVTA
jgi:hypothetical protein